MAVPRSAATVPLPTLAISSSVATTTPRRLFLDCTLMPPPRCSHPFPPNRSTVLWGMELRRWCVISRCPDRPMREAYACHGGGASPNLRYLYGRSLSRLSPPAVLRPATAARCPASRARPHLLGAPAQIALAYDSWPP